MKKELIFDSPASGLVSAVEYNDAKAVILGYPTEDNPRNFHKVLDEVAANVLCPLIAIRFVGTFKWDRILVPFIYPQELDELLPILEAMATVALPRITFLHLLHYDSSKDEIQASDQQLQEWLADHFFYIQTRHLVEAAESRLESVLQQAKFHDLIIMPAAKRYGVQKMVFGSLSDSVVQSCQKPVMVLYTPGGLEESF